MIGGHTTALMRQDTRSSIYLIKGKRQAEKVWCYLCVPSAKTALFEQALQAPKIDTRSYGHILFSGTGAAPAEEVQRIIQTFYT